MAYSPNLSLRKAFAVLECLNLQHHGLTATEVARRTGIPSATAHRLLRDLLSLGYIEWEPISKVYVIGFGLTLFGNKRLVIDRIVRRARPLLQMLAQRTRLTASIGSLAGPQTILEANALHGTAKIGHSVGSRRDAHADSIGKALMALLPKREIQATYESGAMRVHTPQTIRRVDVLLRALAEVRMTGYAIDDEELAPGVRGVASALVNPRGRATCAIAVEGPKDRLDNDAILEVVPLLREAAGSIMQHITDPVAA
jgi:DNA-binding IclR family transcriptional regulator